jgi:hypothetical protein
VGEASISPSFSAAENGGSAVFGCKPIVHISTGNTEDVRHETAEQGPNVKSSYCCSHGDTKKEAGIRNIVLRRWRLRAVPSEHARPGEGSYGVSVARTLVS